MKPTIQNIAVNFGTIVNHPTVIKLYDLPLIERMERLASDHGYNVMMFSAENPKPKGRGYNQGELWIYDPTDASGRFSEGASYATSWRILHELAHALTEAQAVQAFGPTKRGGAFPTTMTPTNAKQALWWETLAIIKQHELLALELGIHCDRKALAQELNTTLFDGMIKIVTGDFSNPDELGFIPSDIMPNFKQVSALVDHYARLAMVNESVAV
jgi:hypothetical protein